MLGQFPCAAPELEVPGAPEGAVVDELPLSVVDELPLVPELVELELSLVCACATIAPPPTSAPARPSVNTPLLIHFCMCITSSQVRCVCPRNSAPTERLLNSRKKRVRICASQQSLSAHTGCGCDARRVLHRRSRFLRFALVVVTLATVFVAPSARAAATTNTVSIGAGLHGPKGLAATVYASGLKKVAALATDAHSRVWAATADASDNDTDAIYLVAKAGATPQKVATDVHTPLGLLWIGDTLYVSQSNGVLALSGFDGTSFATRTTVVSFPDGTGEVNGIAQGTDGRVYVGISAPCNSCTPTARYSASVVSFLPDGTDLQVVANKIRAPIGLAFFPGTNDLFVTMNQRDDLRKNTPGDWLAQVTAGQSWGFPSCYGQSGTKCLGTPDPVAVLDQHAAVSGVAIVTGQLGSTVGIGAVVAEWVTGKVQLVELRKSSSGYTGTARAFLTGFKNPVPVLLDASGGLFVGDWTTGKLYRITG